MDKAIPYHDLLMIRYAIAAALMPLAAFLINALLPGRKNKITGLISTAAILGSCVLSVILFANVWNNPQLHINRLWFTIGDTQVFVGVLLNNLSVVMLALVSVIALAVHVYSTPYMQHDKHYNRYFAYLSLFCFSMLALVIADNLILFYGFWELVGFSSYLLIGFWYKRDKAVQANKKAFIMNRIGDVGLLTALMIVFAHYHTFDIDRLFGSGKLIAAGSISQISTAWQFIAFIGIFLAVAAKSAQFPLHTWLPDAMEGPTSVSALIHAATMVAAGVFLLGRVYPFFTDVELNILAVIGCFTAFMAATIALTQNDLKRILAYSTISQLGFMVMAMGIGAYASSLMHLVTHAFFKCTLFLCAGVIIHEIQHIKDEYNLDIDPQNILYMGGLRKKLPVTFAATVIAALALIGIPLTSGYLSKDGIIVQAFEWSDGKSLWHLLIPYGALLSGILTAFYVARLVFKVFYGDFELKRIFIKIELHVSDGTWAYKGPLIILSLCCLFPLFSLNPVVYEKAWLFSGLGIADHFERMNIYHTIIPISINILNVLVIYFAYTIYVQRKTLVFHQNNFFFRLSFHEWYIDKFYKKVIVKGVLRWSGFLFWFDRNVIDGFIRFLQSLTIIIADLTAWIDRYIIDGFINLLVLIVRSISNFARGFQTGKVQYYLFSMLAIMLAFFIYKMLI